MGNKAHSDNYTYENKIILKILILILYLSVEKYTIVIFFFEKIEGQSIGVYEKVDKIAQLETGSNDSSKWNRHFTRIHYTGKWAYSENI